MPDYAKMKQFTVRVNPATLRWLDKKIDASEFASYSHAFRRMTKIYKKYRRIEKKRMGG